MVTEIVSVRATTAEEARHPPRIRRLRARLPDAHEGQVDASASGVGRANHPLAQMGLHEDAFEAITA